MKIVDTNRLPAALVRAVQNDPYDRGDAKYSVTDLCQPAQLLSLKRRHDDEIEVEALGRLWAVLGQGLHHVLERARPPADLQEVWQDTAEYADALGDGRVVAGKQLGDRTLWAIWPRGTTRSFYEKRFFAEVEGVKVSGQLDRYDTASNCYFHVDTDERVVEDYKLTSVNTLLFGGSSGRGEWEVQLNFLAHLLRVNGLGVDRLEVVTILRDWSWYDWNDYRKYRDGLKASQPWRWKNARAPYPDQEVVVIEVELYPPELAESLMAARVRALEAAERLPDENLPPCTAEERWERGKGGPARCTGGARGVPYCPVVEFCHQERSRRQGGGR